MADKQPQKIVDSIVAQIGMTYRTSYVPTPWLMYWATSSTGTVVLLGNVLPNVLPRTTTA